MSEPQADKTGDRATLELVSEDSEPTQSRGFFSELRDRKVYHTSAIYLAAAWALIQFADVVVPRLGLPDWSVSVAIWALLAGFPVVLVLSWAFEIKSQGWPAIPRAISRVLSSARYVVLWTVLCVFLVAMSTLFFGQFSQKVFALSPRDGVVIGQFQNHTANTLLDSSLGLAFRVGLEQSRHAFIVSHSQIRNALTQMVKEPDADIDRDLGIQIALRVGAKALIVGSVGEVGTTFTLTAEVIDPSDGRTVLIESATVNHIDKILQSLDQLTRKLRARLGESVDAIEKSTLQLERVTTKNIDALKAYSLGINAASGGDVEDAISLFQRAISLDPEFSMAHAKMATLYAAALGDTQKAAEHRNLAQQFSNRLTERERVYIEASQSATERPAEMIRAWRLMRTLFPEEAVGHHNLASVYWRFENNFVDAADSFATAVTIDNPWQNISYHYFGYVQLGLGEAEAALQNFERAWRADAFPIDAGLADALIVLGRHKTAEEFLEQIRRDTGQQLQFEIDMKTADMLIDQGKLRDASEQLARALSRAGEFNVVAAESRAAAANLAVMERAADKEAFSAALRAQIELELSRLEADESQIGFAAVDHLLFLGKIGARSGNLELAESVLSSVQPLAEDSGFFFREAFRKILAGEVALAQGATDEAIRLFLEVKNDRPLFQLRESLARAYEIDGNISAAAAEYDWISQHRGLPFAEVMANFYGKEFSILDWTISHYHLGRLHEQNGDEATARKNYEIFLNQWRFADQGLAMKTAAEQRIAALIQRN